MITFLLLLSKETISVEKKINTTPIFRDSHDLMLDLTYLGALEMFGWVVLIYA